MKNILLIVFIALACVQNAGAAPVKDSVQRSINGDTWIIDTAHSSDVVYFVNIDCGLSLSKASGLIVLQYSTDGVNWHFAGQAGLASEKPTTAYTQITANNIPANAQLRFTTALVNTTVSFVAGFETHQLNR